MAGLLRRAASAWLTPAMLGRQGMGFVGMASVAARPAPAHQRGIGHVHGDKLRGNVLEAWEKREIEKVKSTRDPKNFDEFRSGDAVAVRFLDPHHPSPNKLETFTGICLEVRRLGQWGGSFTLRNNLNGYAVEQQFPYWSPLIKAVRMVSKPKKRPTRNKLFYLRERAPRECTVTVKDKDLNWPKELQQKGVRERMV